MTQPAAYSAVPLGRKLGVGEDDEVALVGAPEGFTDTLLGSLTAPVLLHTDLADDAFYDVIVAFMTSRDELAADLGRLRAQMAPACGLWIAWPKRASKLPTDMSDQAVRDIALPTGLVDNKVCAIDEVWTVTARRAVSPAAARR